MMFPSEKYPQRGPWPVAPISTRGASTPRHTLNQLEEAGPVPSRVTILISWGGVTYKFIEFLSHEDPPKAKSHMTLGPWPLKASHGNLGYRHFRKPPRP